MLRIDAHQHFWQTSRSDYGWLTAETLPTIYRDFMPPDLSPLLQQCDIDRSVLVQCAQTVAETEFLLDIANNTPTVAAVVGWVNLEATDAAETIAQLAEQKKLAGLRPMLQDLPDDQWILRDGVKSAIQAMIEAGLRFDALIFPRHLPVIQRFLDNYSDLSVVIDHGAKPYIARGELQPWAEDMKTIATNSGAFCKLSGLATEAQADWTADTLKPYIDVLLECFGPNRLMWGSDWPVLNLAGNYSQWFEVAQHLTASLSTSEKEQLFGGSAARFYGIENN